MDLKLEIYCSDVRMSTLEQIGRTLRMSKRIYFLSLLHVLILSVSSDYVNIAYKHPAWQKTHHPSNFGPEKAVDGLKSNLSAVGHQCSISANDQTIASWRVNLLGIKFVHHIVIYYRTDEYAWGENNFLAGRFLGFSVYISNTESKDDGSLCFNDTEYNMTTIPAVVNITCELYGQYVIYYNERRSDTVYPPGYSKYAFNELCEVEVYGCAPGFYGPNCSLPCPAHCENCNTENGTCLWCDIGYTGENCDFPCSSATFGVNCTSQCGECVGHCDNRFGNCSGGCKAGYKGIMCNEVCELGKFGENCTQSCGMCVGECFHVNGTCSQGCQPGYQGNLCNTACAPGKYGANCAEYCGNCEGDCNHVHGTCSGGCKTGYKGLICKTKCTPGRYGPNCTSQCGECLGDCSHINGHCSNGCKEGYIGINCNEECALGRYGVNCSGYCGKCFGKCSNVDGSCDGGCKAGFEGITCHNVCDFGFFGANCKHECSIFCSMSRNCSRISGHCFEGCKQGWEGIDCLEMKNHKVNRILVSTETVAILSISLSVNACLLFAYCIRRYDAAQKRKLQKTNICRPRHDYTSEGVQTATVSLDDEEHSEREYSELQYIYGHSQSDYNNM